MRHLILSFLCLLLLAAPAAGQKDFQEYAESQQEEYTRFLQEQDKEFHEYLQKEWEEFRMMSGEQEDPEPKPDRIPKAPQPPEEERPEPSAKPSDEEARVPTSIRVESLPAEEEPSAPPEEPSDQEAVTVELLGHSITFRIDPAWQEISPKGGGKEEIRDFWRQFSGIKSKPVLEQLERYGRELGLGDWGKLVLTERLARAVAGSGSKDNIVHLLMWGWLLKDGRDVRVARDGENVVLLYRCGHEVFQVPYFHLQGSRYYVFGEAEPARIRTYQGDYPGEVKALTLRLASDISAQGPEAERTLEFQFRDQEFQVELTLPKSLVSFLDTFPQLPLHLYFDSPASPVVTEGLVERLQKAVSSMEQEEAVNFLLRFTQKAFNYQTDKEQFGEENYLYPEETLFYPASDCEDRVILFSILVSKVLGLDVAVLDYPGHVATALDIDLSGEGSYVTVDGRTLFVADPTYINARLGMVMPDFADENPRILPLWKSTDLSAHGGGICRISRGERPSFLQGSAATLTSPCICLLQTRP